MRRVKNLRVAIAFRRSGGLELFGGGAELAEACVVVYSIFILGCIRMFHGGVICESVCSEEALEVS